MTEEAKGGLADEATVYSYHIYKADRWSQEQITFQ